MFYSNLERKLDYSRLEKNAENLYQNFHVCFILLSLFSYSCWSLPLRVSFITDLTRTSHAASLTPSLMHSLVNSFVYSLTHSYRDAFVHSFTRPVAHQVLYFVDNTKQTKLVRINTIFMHRHKHRNNFDVSCSIYVPILV